MKAESLSVKTDQGDVQLTIVVSAGVMLCLAIDWLKGVLAWMNQRGWIRLIHIEN